MIPEEASRAAADRYRETLTELRLRERGPFKSGAQHRQALQAALEAAAPHMLATAWDQGELAGSAKKVLEGEYPQLGLTTNPYRRTDAV